MANFSVAMCLYHKDNPEYFKCAFDSIIEQTVQPKEIVLVIDGPIGEQLEEAVAYAKNKFYNFNIIRFAENKGHGEARRIGFENCTSEFIAIMDSDDISVHNRFELQLNAFEREKCDIVGGQIIEFVNDINEPIGKRIVPNNDLDIKKYAKKRCPMNQVTVMIKKDAYIDSGGYLDWYQDEDYYLWLRMIIKGKRFYNVDDVLVNVRVGDEMYSRRGGKKYFKSEKKLQKFMLKNKLITFIRYSINVFERFIVQIIMTNKMRSRFFKRIRN